MSVAGLKYSGVQQWGHSSPAETKSASYIYAGSASAYHDWDFRTAYTFCNTAKSRSESCLKSCG